MTQIGDDGVPRLGHRSAEHRVARGIDRSQTLLRLGWPAESLEAASDAHRLAIDANVDSALASAQHALVALIAGVGDPCDDARHTSFDDVIGSRRSRDIVATTHAVVALWSLTDRTNDALRLAQHLVRSAREAGVPWVRAVPLQMAGELHLLLGHVVDAQGCLDEALEVCHHGDGVGVAGRIHATRALLAAQQGDRSACSSQAQRALECTRVIDRPWVEMSINRALALLAMSEGDFGLGARELERNRTLQAAAGIAAPGAARWEGDYVLCLVGSGQRDRAEDAVERLEDRSERAGSRWGRSVALRGRALLEKSQAESCAREAIALQADLPFEQACSRLVLGEILRQQGRVRSARVELRHAAEQFAACAAWPWMARAESGIRATGTRRASSDSARSQLTEQELRVALAVADGATNRETAAGLFVSEKTVEYHLGKVFRKMGVTNRTQLAGRMLRQVPA